MKKKLIVAAAATCSLIVGLIIVARITGMLQYYNIPTPSNEPNIKVGGLVYVSNLKQPMPRDFIVFTSKYADSINISYLPDHQSGTHYLHRLCGVPGNILEMKNGVLYVNDKNFDSGLNLNNDYKITNTEFYSIDEEDMNNRAGIGRMHMISNDTGIVTFDDAMRKKYGSTFKLVPYCIIDQQGTCFAWCGKSQQWTPDNFGPLTIPADCYFVLGDNRHNALDSRYTGFVKKENIKGVALNK